jgi:hypothetical protein
MRGVRAAHLLPGRVERLRIVRVDQTLKVGDGRVAEGLVCCDLLGPRPALDLPLSH